MKSIKGSKRCAIVWCKELQAPNIISMAGTKYHYCNSCFVNPFIVGELFRGDLKYKAIVDKLLKRLSVKKKVKK